MDSTICYEIDNEYYSYDNCNDVFTVNVTTNNDYM